MVIKGDCQASSIANYRIPADHRRERRSLPGRWRWCDRPRFCDAQKASALHTLIRQRHPTPLCGGHAPTAERTMNPARMCLESLERRPGIREQPGPKAAVAECLLSRRCWGLSRRTPELPLAAAAPFSPQISDARRLYIRARPRVWLRGLAMSAEATLPISKLHRAAAGAPARPRRLGRSQDRALPLDGLQT